LVTFQITYSSLETSAKYNESAFVHHSFLKQWNQWCAPRRMSLIKFHVREFLCECPLCCLHTCSARRNITAPFIAPVKACHKGDIIATTDILTSGSGASLSNSDREISEHLQLTMLINSPYSVCRYTVVYTASSGTVSFS